MEHPSPHPEADRDSTAGRHPPERRHLPNRRPGVEGQRAEVPVGFAAQGGAVHEVFLVADKEGSMLNCLLADAAVAVALQHGVALTALAKSAGRLPNACIAPADLDRPQPGRRPS